MPKKVEWSSSERVDESDLTYGTSTYAHTLSAFDNKNILNGNLAQFLTGFHIQLIDQVANPGQIAIYNGKFINSQGALVTNEDAVNASQTITLSGTTQTFYLEVQLTETLSDVDDRAIWDPTVDNGVGTLPGKEFVDSLSTRITQSWSVVAPVSTTSFELTSNPNSLKIPLAIIKTDSLGRITSSVNTGLFTSLPGAYNTETVNVSDNKIIATDLTTFLGTGSITITDGVNTETKTISSIDRANYTITVTSPFINSYAQGSRVEEISTNRFFIRERRTSDLSGMTGGTSTHPDKKRKLFSGDEGRGKALLKSVGSSLNRDDLSIRNTSDQTDYIASIIREMKFGNPGIGNVNPSQTFPATQFGNLRYYDFAGSIMGAKEATFTIGDGTNSLGDFNGTSHQPFVDAINAAILTGQNAVKLVVKPGNYSFTSTVSATIGVLIEGAVSPYSSFDYVEISNNTNTNTLFSTSNTYFGLKNIRLTTTVAGCQFVSFTNTVASILYYDMIDCAGSVSGRIVSNSGANMLKVNISTCAISSSIINDYFIATPVSGVLSGSISNTTLAHTNSSATSSMIFGTVITALKIDNCQFSYAGTANILSCNSANTDYSVTNNTLIYTGTGSTSVNNGYCINLGALSLRAIISSNRMYCSNPSNYVKFIYMSEASRVSISDNSLFNVGASGGLGASNPRYIYLTSNITDVSITNNTMNITSNAATSNDTCAAIGIVSAAVFGLNIVGNNISVDRDASCVYGTSCQYNTVNLHNNMFAGGTSAGNFNESVEPSGPQLAAAFPCINVTDNTYNGKAGPTHAFHTGFLFNRMRGYTNLNITGNTIENLLGDEASGIRLADYQLGGLSSSAGIPVAVISGNKISRLAGLVYANGITCVNSFSRIQFTDNKITFVGAPEAYGIFVDAAQEVHANSNTISYVLGTTSGGSITGIRAGVCTLFAEGNRLDSIGSGGTITTGTVYGIRCISIPCNISNNGIYSLYTSNTLTNSAAIKLEGQCNNSVIANNNLVSSGMFGIYLVNTSATFCRGLIIKGNVIDCFADATLGIVLSGATSSDALYSITIDSNIVRNYNAGVNSAGIYVNRGKVLTISNNVVEESLTVPAGQLHNAVSLFTCEHFVISGNSFTGYTAANSAFRNAIQLNTSCTHFSITGNTCIWSNDTTTGGAEMSLNNSTFGNISGNFIQGSTNAGVRYGIAANNAAGVGIAGNHFKGTFGVIQIENTFAVISADTSTNPASYDLNSVIG
jgi:hypothetical protein